MQIRSATGRVLLCLLFTGLVPGCGHMQPAPEGFHPEEYTPVSIEQLQAPRQAGLMQGHKVSVDGYFWQFLDYDPFMLAGYFAWARQPLVASQRRWASLYHTPHLQGYYDRLVLTREQWRQWHFKRLEQVRVFGRLTQLGFGILYLQVHHVDRLDKATDPPHPQPTPPRLEGPAESPSL